MGTFLWFAAFDKKCMETSNRFSYYVKIPGHLFSTFSATLLMTTYIINYWSIHLSYRVHSHDFDDLLSFIDQAE